MSRIVIDYTGDLAAMFSDGRVRGGNRILLKSGTYMLGDLTPLFGGSPGLPVTIAAYGDGPVTIAPPVGAVRGFLFSGVHDIILDGLIIDAANVQADGIKITEGATNIIISNCEIKNAPGQGILLTHGNGQTTNPIIDGCNIHHCGTDEYDHGIYISTGGTIRNCTIGNVAGYGIHAFGGSGDYLIECNYIYGPAYIGIGAMYGNARIVNNVVRGASYRSFRACYDLHNMLIAHNTADTIHAGDRTTDDPATWQIVNNLYTTSIITPGVLDGVTITNTNNLQLSGDYSDDGAAGIHPLPGNPAIGVGVAVDGITTDYGGNARANPPTIGAWEA